MSIYAFIVIYTRVPVRCGRQGPFHTHYVVFGISYLLYIAYVLLLMLGAVLGPEGLVYIYYNEFTYPLPDAGDLHGGPFGRRDRAPAVGGAPALARTRPMHPRDRPSIKSNSSLNIQSLNCERILFTILTGSG